MLSSATSTELVASPGTPAETSGTVHERAQLPRTSSLTNTQGSQVVRSQSVPGLQRASPSAGHGLTASTSSLTGSLTAGVGHSQPASLVSPASSATTATPRGIGVAHPAVPLASML